MKKNILFCGTPKFATPSLKTIFNCQEELSYNLKGVITIPDKKSGRGQKKQESDIKKEAKKLNLNIFEPHDLLDVNFIKKIKQLNLDLIIVVAFKKLPQKLFQIPKLGTINLHASLLPKYRGAAPINWAIINGEKETGLTTFFINTTIDTGDIILQSNIHIDKDWSAGELHDVLVKESPSIIKKTIELVLYKKYNLIKQTLSESSLAPKIKKQDRKLNIKDFISHNKYTLNKLYDFLRGMTPPGVTTCILIHYNRKSVIKKTIIIQKVSPPLFIKNNNNSTTSNTLLIPEIKIKNKTLVISTDHIEIEIQKIKVENGKEISSQEFINGFLQKCIKITFDA